MSCIPGVPLQMAAQAISDLKTNQKFTVKNICISADYVLALATLGDAAQIELIQGILKGEVSLYC